MTLRGPKPVTGKEHQLGGGEASRQAAHDQRQVRDKDAVPWWQKGRRCLSFRSEPVDAKQVSSDPVGVDFTVSNDCSPSSHTPSSYEASLLSPSLPKEGWLTCVKLKSVLMASGMRGGKANQLLH